MAAPLIPTHPDACASCGCIRRHAHWCRGDSARLADDLDRWLAEQDACTAASEASEAAAEHWAEELA